MHSQVRGETLARLAEQIRDSHGGRISFHSNARAALLIPVYEDDAGILQGPSNGLQTLAPASLAPREHHEVGSHLRQPIVLPFGPVREGIREISDECD